MKLIKVLGVVVAIVVLVASGWLARGVFSTWLTPEKTDAATEKEADGPERVKISPQAQANLRLVVKPVALQAYWRKIDLPGVVVDRPGHSDRGIPAPITGVVTMVKAVPGKTVRAGDELFRIRLASETFQASQMELFKATHELEIVKKERKRLEAIPAGAVPSTRILDLEYQEDRLNVSIKAHRQDLRVRQLTPQQIEAIEKGQFVTEVVIRMPDRSGHASEHAPEATKSPGASALEYEVQELKVNLGDHVQAGQVLAYLADHRRLYIEGRALRQEARLLAQASQENWPVEAEFTEDAAGNPGERFENLGIEFLGATMDASGLTLPVYVPFENPPREYTINGAVYRTGRYRPGQKVLLKVSVEKMPDVFVLPAAAIVREGPETYIFRQNGVAFDRRPVHVLHEDYDKVVVANDGSIVAGVHFIVHNGAAALNRVLKASQAEGGGGHHHHHHH